MAEIENLVLEQSRLIREDFRRMDKRFDDLEAKVDELGVRAQSTEGVLFGLGGYIRSIDERVEHIEKKLGI
jgi:tetrahydromethanopterin S-methyltransferase subunit G